MYSRTIRRLILTTLIILPVLAAGRAEAARKQDVLVVPARQRTVAMAFDVQAMRDLVMITYRGTATTQAPLMHVWSPSAKAWQELSAEAYAFGQFTPSQPGTLFLIGTDRDLPASVIEGAAQAAQVVRIDSISMAEIANTLNQHLTFSPREWQALAERHGLQTRDLNYARRKWGRFGPPASARTDEPETIPSPEVEDAAPPPPEDIAGTTALNSPAEPQPAVATDPVKIEMPAEPAVTEPEPAVTEPEPAAPFVLDDSAGAPLEPEPTVPPPATMIIEEKGVTPPAALPSIDELLPEDK